MSAPALPLVELDQSAGRRVSDGATLGMLFVLCQTVFPARLVLAVIPISLSPADVVALLATMAWAYATCTLTLGMAKGRSPVRTMLFVYFLANLLTYGLATAGYMPADELKLSDHALVLVLAHTGLAIAVCDGVRSLDRLEKMLRAVVVGGAIMSFIGVLQFTVDYDATRLLELPGLRPGTTGGVIDDRGGLNRVGSTASHPIEFGVVCAMVLPLALHFAFSAREKGERARRWWLCAGLIGCGLLFSLSRSAIMGLGVVGLILLVVWPPRRTIRLLGAGAGFTAIVAAAFPGMISTFYGLFANFGADPSVEYRRHRYEIAQLEFSKHPWFGRGIGTWYVPKYFALDNQWIMTGLEAGAAGVAVFAGILVVGIYAGLRVRYARQAAPDVRWLLEALAALLAVPAVGSFTFDLLSFHIATGVMFLLIGATGALLRIHREASP
ncbi:O-antigen ligase family protein [Actinocorallia lasiicapitis]